MSPEDIKKGMENPKFVEQWNICQYIIIKELFDKKPEYKTDAEWNIEKANFSVEHGKEFRELVKNNMDLYHAVIEGKFKEVAQKVIEMSGVKVAA